MKIKLTGADEWYPVYDFREPSHPYYEVSSGHEVNVDARIVKRWVKAREAFDKMQLEVQKLTDDAERAWYEQRYPGEEYVP